MESVSVNELIQALRDVGLKFGDIVNVYSRLYSIGFVQGIPVTDIPEVYIQAIKEVIGDEGTIVVPTYTTSFGRFGTPFILESSPSEMGVFSERVRQIDGALRTLHPVDSLTALGAQARVLTHNHPRWNVGHDTIWHRMMERDGKVLGLGVSPRKGMSIIHQAEYLACVPYLYNKILQGEVYACDQRVQDNFYMAVRYLDYGISYDLTQLEIDLLASGALKRIALGGDFAWMVSMQSSFDTSMEGLRKDPYYLLEAVPSFVYGEIPFDGTTIEREGVAPQYFLT